MWWPLPIRRGRFRRDTSCRWLHCWARCTLIVEAPFEIFERHSYLAFALQVLDELLPAIDVVSAACKGCIGHSMHGERGYIGRADDAPDRQRTAELLAACIKLIAEERCR